ncbi:MAG: hemerythrin domain-containing protein [Pseudomonadota bacterium]
MSSLSEFLTDDHHACDDLFAAAENAAAVKDWAQARERFGLFAAAMARHFAREETVLFPAFEARTGNSGGPTFVMRSEHVQMNGLLADMAARLERSDGPGFLGQAETLLMLMRQHNLKEENILYPMSDQALADQQPDLLERMEVLGA